MTFVNETLASSSLITLVMSLKTLLKNQFQIIQSLILRKNGLKTILN